MDFSCSREQVAVLNKTKTTWSAAAWRGRDLVVFLKKTRQLAAALTEIILPVPGFAKTRPFVEKMHSKNKLSIWVVFLLHNNNIILLPVLSARYHGGSGGSRSRTARVLSV